MESTIKPSGDSFTVWSWSTPASLAYRIGVGLESLLDANPWMHDSARVQPGTVIRIPEPENTISTDSPYHCKSGLIVTLEWPHSPKQIAERFGLDVRALCRANPGIDKERMLAAGQRLCIPHIPPPPCIGGAYVIVREGETAQSVAAEHRIELSTLMAANPRIRSLAHICRGQLLCVPGKERVKTTAQASPERARGRLH